MATLREQVARIDKLTGMWLVVATNEGTHGQPAEVATWWREVSVADGGPRIRGRVGSTAGYERKFPEAFRRAGELRAELRVLIHNVGSLERARARLAYEDEVERMASARALCARLVASGRIPAGVPVRVEYAGNEARRVLVLGQEGQDWVGEVVR